ncbi:bifunctional 2-dehydro-3-deoxygluconokinase/2-dehydro-3-deoxygalactonokinase [Halobacterium hubeiense]|uniref:bifunctional 2-dehydro-3-deoxygluconokinase/2-dehydro-3- deoxygalactonokinase n=1 Tax=Halobacterium hubeiense TaxID=1407499 RepID=UPI003C78F64C
MDLVTFGETLLRLSPPGQERLERATELEFRAAGAESNVAVNAGRLGADTAWLSKLPDSPLGRKVTATLRAQGTRPDVAWSETGRQGTYYLEQAGEPRGTNVVYDRANAAVTTATPEELATERVDSAEYFYTSGITPALSETLAETTAALLERAQAAGTTTSLDVNYRAKLWDPEEAREVLETLFPDVDVLVVAERDARRVLAPEGSASEIARGLADEFGFETVVVTLGADGALAVRDGDVHEQPAFDADTHDAVGTGDAFVGGFLARRIEGGDVADALEWGAATAALKRTMPGDTALVTRAEVEDVLAGDAGAIDR